MDYSWKISGNNNSAARRYPGPSCAANPGLAMERGDAQLPLELIRKRMPGKGHDSLQRCANGNSVFPSGRWAEDSDFAHGVENSVRAPRGYKRACRGIG
jgi:hypothetical protein